MKLFLLFVPVLLSAQQMQIASALNYYVDSVNGSDSNPPGLPYKTQSHLQTIDTSHPRPIWNYYGNTILHEEALVPRSYMIIKQVGTGSTPWFYCDDAISAGAWSKTAGQTSVYQASLTTESGSPSDPDWYTSVWENGTRFTIAHSIASVNSTASSYYATTSDVGAHIILYIHASDGSNPGSNGFTYEYSARQYGINATGRDHISLLNMNARRNINANGSIGLGRYAYVSNVIVQEGNKHNIFFDSGTYMIGVTAKGSYYESLGSSMFIGYGTAPNGSYGFDFVNCVAMNYGLQDATTPGFFSHSADGVNNWDHSTFTNSTGLIAGSTLSMTAINSTILGQIGSAGSTSITVTNSTITGTTVSQQYAIFANAANAVVTVSGTTITGANKNTTSYTGIGTTGSGTTINVTNSTIQGVYGGVSNAGANSITIMTGNTFDVGNTVYAHANASGTETITSNNNIFKSFSPQSAATVANVTKTWSQWLTLGYDANSTYLHPKWNFASTNLLDSTHYQDSDAYGYTLAFVGTPTANSGWITVSNTNYVNGVPPVGLSGAGTGTIVAVVRWGGTINGMSSSAFVANQATGWSLRAGNNSAGKVNGGFYFATTLHNAGTSTVRIDDGNWHSWIIVYDGTNVHQYVDGTESGTFAGPFSPPIAANFTTANTSIAIGNQTTGGSGWTGDIAYIEPIDHVAMNSTQVAVEHATLKTALAGQGVTLP